jgi:hypothetical protein
MTPEQNTIATELRFEFYGAIADHAAYVGDGDFALRAARLSWNILRLILWVRKWTRVRVLKRAIGRLFQFPTTGETKNNAKQSKTR